MAERFKNGALVYRLWPDGSNEIDAEFQYVTSADTYCKVLTDNRDWAMVRICKYTGLMRVFTADYNNNTNPEAPEETT